MRYFLILLLTISFTQELQVEGDLTVSGAINSAVIDSLQNEIFILNSMIESLSINQSVVVSEFVELDIEILVTNGGVSDQQYLDFSNFATEIGDFNRVSVLGFEHNDLFEHLRFECAVLPGDATTCFGENTDFQDSYVYGTGVWMFRSESPILRYYTWGISSSGYATLYLLIEKF
jgi:hypothetical protein